MTGAPRVFLDANVLFSAALRGPVFGSILELADAEVIALVSSRACVAEAVTNLERKRPGSIDGLAGVLARVTLTDPDLTPHVAGAAEMVGAEDAHVLAAAMALEAVVLLTGDTKDFGDLMNRDDLSLRVRTPRRFLIEGTL